MKSLYRLRVEEFERRFLRRMLRKHGGHRLDVAKALGMTYRELRYHVYKLGLRERPNKLKDLSEPE